ncbi:hypothetical protein GBF38_011302 [Nibea albiflora]|uniref:Uncharacterized protein n=1 Tax=Nibea albiflora TaxID=240163 RepID=A0ACB7EUG0_NIBAL|nr:hypothetical protein GBF38_011302 [Nibea albiflora]
MEKNLEECTKESKGEERAESRGEKEIDCNYTHGCPSERTSDVSPTLLRYLSLGASVPSALRRAFPP